MPSKEEYWKNPDKHRAAARAYAKDHPEWKKDSAREWAAKKRAEDPDFVEREKAAQKRYREKDPAKRVAATREWAARKPGIYLFYNAKARAKKFGVPFDLVPEDIVIPEFCPAIGIPIEATVRGRRGFHPNSPSLDRVVPEKGYVRGNVAIISNRANWIKRDATAEELRGIADYVDRMNGAVDGPP